MLSDTSGGLGGFVHDKNAEKMIIVNKSCGNVISKVKQNTGCIFRLEN